MAKFLISIFSTVIQLVKTVITNILLLKLIFKEIKGLAQDHQAELGLTLRPMWSQSPCSSPSQTHRCPQMWLQVQALLLTSCVAFGKFLSLSGL